MNSLADNRNQIKFLEKQINCSSLRCEKSIDDVIVIDDEENKSNTRITARCSPSLIKLTQHNDLCLNSKSSDVTSSAFCTVYKSNKGINSFATMPMHSHKYSTSKSTNKGTLSIGNKVANYLFINADGDASNNKIHPRQTTTDIICLEESNSDEGGLDNSSDFSAHSIDMTVLDSTAHQNLNSSQLGQKQHDVISLFQEYCKDDLVDSAATYRPVAQLLFNIGESLAQTYPFRDADMVDLIAKCAAKCKDEINYEYFIQALDNPAIRIEENFLADVECVKNKIVDENLFGDDKKSSLPYSLRKRSSSNYNCMVNHKRIKLDRAENNINKIKKDSSVAMLDESAIPASSAIESNAKADRSVAQDSLNDESKIEIKDVTNKSDENSIPEKENKLKTLNLDPFILPLKKCECEFNTQFSTVLFEHLKHGRSYTQASCCLCGFYTPLFTKFVLHMKSEHLITVNNKLYKVTESLQCPFCKYEAYNLPTICRHMKFCNARFLKNIFAPKADENDIPLKKMLQTPKLNQMAISIGAATPKMSQLPQIKTAAATSVTKEFANIQDKTETNPSNYVICPICQGSVTESLETHMSVVHNKAKDAQTKSFLCRQCSPMKVFNSRAEFDVHSLNTHCGGATTHNCNAQKANVAGNNFVNNFLEYKNQTDEPAAISLHIVKSENATFNSNILDDPASKEELKSCINDFIRTETKSINGDIETIERNRNEDMHAGKININSMVAGYRCDYCKILFEDVARLEYHILRAHHRHFPSHNLLWRLVYHRAIGNCYDASETLINTGHKMHQNCPYCHELYEENFLLYRHIFLNHSTTHLSFCHWCADFASAPTANYKNFLDDQINIHRTERSIKEFTKDSITAKLGSYIDSIRKNVSAKKSVGIPNPADGYSGSSVLVKDTFVLNEGGNKSFDSHERIDDNMMIKREVAACDPCTRKSSMDGSEQFDLLPLPVTAEFNSEASVFKSECVADFSRGLYGLKSESVVAECLVDNELSSILLNDTHYIV